MKQVTIFHPFSAAAVGLNEDIIVHSHSRPHAIAMEKLAKDGFNATIEYFTDNYFPYRIKQDSVTWRFWPVSKRWSSNHKKFKKQWSVWADLRFTYNAPDLTIINTSGHVGLFPFHIAKTILQKRKSYVAMVGGSHFSLTPEAIKYYHEANHILVHTHLQKRHMEEMPELKNCDIRVFPLGVDCDKYIPSNESIKKGGPCLLYVGRITDLKRIHLAVEALDLIIRSGIKQAILKIVGPKSSHEYFNYLQKSVRDKGLEESVSFEGFIEYSALIKYYQEADLLLLPSEHESFGMVMIESMACGTPVAAIIGSGGPDDVITNNVDGLVSSVDEYTEKILELFQAPAMLESLSNNARKTAVEKYSNWQTYQVLKETVESSLL